MYDHRIPVCLDSQYPLDKRLLATLNRFHFRSIYLHSRKSSPYVLRYANNMTLAERNIVLMPRGSETKIEGRGVRVLKRDYLGEIVPHFDDYLSSVDKIQNRKLRNNLQLVPTVDILVDEFEADVIKQFKLSPPSVSRGFAVALTHDVDYVGFYPIGNLRSGLVFLRNSLKTGRNWRVAVFYLRAALRFFTGRVDYYGFEQILEIAKRHDFRPVFFLFSKLLGGNNMALQRKQRLRNPNYSLKNQDIVRALKAMADAGAEIGLHGSYKSANDQELLLAEKKNLEEVTGLACDSIRQHYLNIYGRVTHEIYSRIGIEVESTCGFVTENGYLCGTTRPFYASLPHDGRNHVIVLPMVFMDAVPLYFRPKGVTEVFDQLRETLQQLKKFNGFAAFNFHQRMISCFPEYRELYENLVIEVKKMGGEIATTREMGRLYPPCSCSYE